MFNFVHDLLMGWSEVRSSQGYSYQVSRAGERRVVQVDDYGRRGEIDAHWLATGEFSEVTMRRQYKNRFIPRFVKPTRILAGV